MGEREERGEKWRGERDIMVMLDFDYILFKCNVLIVTGNGKSEKKIEITCIYFICYRCSETLPVFLFKAQ